jgi:hypothetical protein
LINFEILPLGYKIFIKINIKPMKKAKLILLSLLALVLALNVSIAQNYKSQFNINATGQIENDKGVKLGTIEKDGTIKNSKGDVTGKAVKNNKGVVLSDKLGKKMGAVSEDGTLTGANGKVLFKISTADENGICKILDVSGKEVGTVHENYKQQGACAFHCLNKKK